MEMNTGTYSNDEYCDAEDCGRPNSSASSLSTSSLKKFVYHDKCNLDKARLSDSFHSYSFAASPTRHVSAMSPSPRSNEALNGSWKFFNFVGVDENEHVYNGASRKSSEAVLTINAKTSRILVANRTACRLFNYKEEELCSGKKIYDLFTMEDGIKQEILIERNIDTNGNIVMASGKILEGVDSNGNVFILSVWMKRIKSGEDPRCVVIMEPVDVTKGSFLFDGDGIIKDCDFQFSYLFGYEEPQQIVGTHIHKYIPALLLPSPGKPIEKNVRKQRTTSRTKDSVVFPSTIKVKIHDPDFHELYVERTHPSQWHNSKFLYKGLIWVFANVSGLATISMNGLITSCNSNFLQTFLGYTETELLGKDVTFVIPNFYEQIELLQEGSMSMQSGSVSIHSVNSGEYPEESFEKIDEIVSVNSSASTISEVNSSQSASTLEDVELVSGTKLSRDSGIGSNNRSRSKNIDCKENTNEHLLACTDEHIHCKLNIDNVINKEQQDSNEIGYKDVNSLLIRSSTEPSQSKDVDSGLLHIKTSTPKTSNECKQSMRKELHLDLNHNSLSIKKEGSTHDLKNVIDVKSSELIRDGSNVTDDYVYIQGTETQLVDTDTFNKDNCDYVNVDNSAVKDNIPGSSDDVTEGPLIVETKQFSDYAIKTSEFSLLGSPLLEIEFHDNSHTSVLNNADMQGKSVIEKTDNSLISSVDMAKQDKINIEKTTSDLENLSNKGSAHILPCKSDVQELKDPKINNFMRDINTKGTMNIKTDKGDCHQIQKGLKNLELSPKKEKASKRIIQGFYYGQAQHKDDSLLPVLFEIKKIQLKSKEEVFCIWISRDPDEDGENMNNPEVSSLLNSLNSTMNNSTGNYQELLNSMKDLAVEDPGRGKYCECYLNLGCVGKGAFGFVNLAERKSDKEQVIVKFIRKEKVLKDSWVENGTVGRIPFEIFLLMQLQHPHIVKVLEWYENEDYFQMIMEKHGDGIDLFEFIDKKPQMDEALASYMYRQVLKATEYLHSLNILHRDIKDENIIVDRQFNIKLIDFGSAIYIEEGKLFNTFCGTVEYCSPEVLLGNWYKGPELEMWSLGVTLYTFIFGEHPFFEVEETIQGELYPPFKVSNELMFGLCWMLNSDVNCRARLKDLLIYPWFTRHVDVRKYDYDTVLGLNAASKPEQCSSSNERNNEDVNEQEVNSDEYLDTSKCSRSSSSLSSSSCDSSASKESNSQNEGIQDKYKPFLAEPLDLRTDEDVLSKSF